MKINHDVIVGKRNSNCISCGTAAQGAAKGVSQKDNIKSDKIFKGTVDYYENS